MDSWIELRNEKKKCIYTQNEFDEMPNNIVKLSLDTYFEYTDDENDVLWFETIKRFAENKLMIHITEHFVFIISRNKIS